MALSLCEETLTFQHPDTVLGYCLHDPDEPLGDDFETRCANAVRVRECGHARFDAADGIVTPQDVIAHLMGVDDEVASELPEDGVDGGESYVVTEEVRSVYARYCASSPAAQAAYQTEVEKHICKLVGVKPEDWCPPEDFVLDAIQDEPSNKALRQLAVEAISAEFHDEWVDALKADSDRWGDEPYDWLDVAIYAAASVRNGHVVENVRSRKNWILRKETAEKQCLPRHEYLSGRVCTRKPRGFLEWVIPKRVRECERRETIRGKPAPRIRDLYLDLFEESLDDLQTEFLTVRDQLQLSPRNLAQSDIEDMNSDPYELDDRMYELLVFFGFERDYGDIAGLPGYMPSGSRFRADMYRESETEDERASGHNNECTCMMCVNRDFEDFYDDWPVQCAGDDEGIESGHPDDSIQALIDRFGDSRDHWDDRDDWYYSDSVFDAVVCSHSTKLRLTNRYRGMNAWL